MAPNLRSVPQVMPPAPSQRMASPSQQGWVWNGSNWCWDPDDPCNCPPTSPPFPCPPSGFPTPCPPWFPPPAGQAPWYPGANGGVSFSATPPANPIRGNLWWDGQVLHLFDGAAWVDIGPQVAGASGTKGVTDGSVASPGMVGEVISQMTSGSVSVIPPPGAAATTFAALVVPAGDWNLQGTVSVHDLTVGCYWDYITFSLVNGTTNLNTFSLTGNFTGANGFVGGTYSCSVIQLSVSATVTINCSLSVVGLNGGTSGTGSYNFTTTGRRMR